MSWSAFERSIADVAISQDEFDFLHELLPMAVLKRPRLCLFILTRLFFSSHQINQLPAIGENLGINVKKIKLKKCSSSQECPSASFRDV